MTEYFDRFEEDNGTNIHHRDRALLTSLTRNTLFCKSCFLPVHEKHYQRDLTSPFVALLDFLSTLLFPLALLPMLFILPVLMAYEYAINWAGDGGGVHDKGDKKDAGRQHSNTLTNTKSNIALLGTLDDDISYQE